MRVTRDGRTLDSIFGRPFPVQRELFRVAWLMGPCLDEERRFLQEEWQDLLLGSFHTLKISLRRGYRSLNLIILSFINLFLMGGLFVALNKSTLRLA